MQTNYFIPIPDIDAFKFVKKNFKAKINRMDEDQIGYVSLVKINDIDYFKHDKAPYDWDNYKTFLYINGYSECDDLVDYILDRMYKNYEEYEISEMIISFEEIKKAVDDVRALDRKRLGKDLIDKIKVFDEDYDECNKIITDKRRNEAYKYKVLAGDEVDEMFENREKIELFTNVLWKETTSDKLEIIDDIK